MLRGRNVQEEGSGADRERAFEEHSGGGGIAVDGVDEEAEAGLHEEVRLQLRGVVPRHRLPGAVGAAALEPAGRRARQP